MSDSIKLDWEREGVYYIAYLAEREIVIAPRMSRSGATVSFELRIDGMGLVGRFSTVREAKARAQQEADKIYVAVQ